MDSPIISIRFDGGDADAHVIDMRLLGESLIGIDRIVSDGLIAISERRQPKRGERALLVLKAKEPVQGSYEVVGYLRESAALLALGLPIVQQMGSDFLLDWFKLVISWTLGRKSEAEAAMEAIVAVNDAHLAARDRSEQRTHEERMAYLDVLSQTALRLGPAAAQAVAPVGPSVARLGFAAGQRKPVEIDEPTADLLREHGDVEWGDLQSMKLKTDGFTFHTGRLSVEHPDRSGFLLAEVRDPVFKEEANPYTLAAQTKAAIRVTAKPGYSAGRLTRIAIMDFGEVVDDAP